MTVQLVIAMDTAIICAALLAIVISLSGIAKLLAKLSGQVEVLIGEYRRRGLL